MEWYNVRTWYKQIHCCESEERYNTVLINPGSDVSRGHPGGPKPSVEHLLSPLGHFSALRHADGLFELRRTGARVVS